MSPGRSAECPQDNQLLNGAGGGTDPCWCSTAKIPEGGVYDPEAGQSSNWVVESVRVFLALLIPSLLVGFRGIWHYGSPEMVLSSYGTLYHQTCINEILYP